MARISASVECDECGRPVVVDLGEDGMPSRVLCIDCDEEMTELAFAQADLAECRCYCVGDTADASGCPLHKV